MTTTDTEPLYTKQGPRYKPTTLSEQGAWGFADLMIVAAFRYCCGRSTYISGVCAEWIVDKWHSFPERQKDLIRRELEEEFSRDDEDRASGATHKALGWDCDRREWEKVRALWAGEQQPAQPCQPTAAEIDYRARRLMTEMDEVGTALLKTHPDAGRDLQDAADALKQALEQQHAHNAVVSGAVGIQSTES